MRTRNNSTNLTAFISNHSGGVIGTAVRTDLGNQTTGAAAGVNATGGGKKSRDKSKEPKGGSGIT